jgi:hypothetical protein
MLIGFLVVAGLVVALFFFRVTRVTAGHPEMAAQQTGFPTPVEVQPRIVTAQNLSFGPVIEREITNDFMLDFDTGKTAGEFPESVTKPDSIVENVLAGFDWMRQEGFDFACLQHDGTFNVGMRLKELTPTDFDYLEAAQLAVDLTVINGAMNHTKLKINSNGPSIYGFQTREGAIGLLQVNSFPGDPDRLRIRYKLVQNSEAQKPKPDSLVGQVMDQNGKSLANVRWRISAIEEWRDGQWELIHNLGWPQWSSTDADGRFTLNFQGKQRFDLQFENNGELAPAFVYEVSPAAQNLKVVMKPGIPFHGTVIASNSDRIPGNVHVELMLPGRDVWYQQETLTDADGHFTFYVCAPPIEPNKALPAKWQISCAGTVVRFEATTEKSIGMNLTVDARAEIIVNTNAPIAK